jgi:prepilin-type N-terminal cleavage/methylation domain-containing protein
MCTRKPEPAFRRRAFTLVEMMVAMALMVVATSMIAGFFSFFARQMMRYEGRQDLILQVEKAMMRMQSTMSEARSSLVTYSTAINGIYFPTADSVSGTVQFNTSTGALAWQAWLGYGYDSTTSTVWEARQTFSSTDAVGQVPSVAPTSWTRRVLAHYVQSFTVTGPVNSAYRILILVKDADGYQAEFASTVVAPN